MSNNKKITRTNWRSSFSITGKPRLTKMTFKIDEQGKNSSWIYNSMAFPVDAGEKHGNVWVECMGGYSPDRNIPIYAHGKDESGHDDFSKQILVDWEDRFNDKILEEIGEMSFIIVGLERTSEGKVYRKKFLSEYDAIKYAKEHLTNDMIVNVGGDLEYSLYKGRTSIKKSIKRIVLIENQEEAVPSARFTQSVLIDKDSANLKNADKDKGVVYVDARVLNYVKEINGVEIKGQYPFNVQFEFPLNLSDEKLCKAVMDKLFKVKKGVTQINFEGEFIESGATVMPTYEDLQEDVKWLVDNGYYSLEEALKKCATSGDGERRMLLVRPVWVTVGEGENETQLLRIDERYDEEDLIFEDVLANNEDETPWEEDDDSGSTDDSMDWLNDLP